MGTHKLLPVMESLRTMTQTRLQELRVSSSLPVDRMHTCTASFLNDHKGCMRGELSPEICNILLKYMYLKSVQTCHCLPIYNYHHVLMVTSCLCPVFLFINNLLVLCRTLWVSILLACSSYNGSWNPSPFTCLLTWKRREKIAESAGALLFEP